MEEVGPRWASIRKQSVCMTCTTWDFQTFLSMMNVIISNPCTWEDRTKEEKSLKQMLFKNKKKGRSKKDGKKN